MPKGIAKVKVGAKRLGSRQKSIMSFFPASEKSSTLTCINKDMDEMTQKKEANKGEATLRKGCLESEENTDCPSTPPSKRLKSMESPSSKSDGGTENKANTNPPLTPEQKTMISEKAIAARMLKLRGSLSILDPAMGTTWMSALEDEFKKDYFKKLNDFVVSARGRSTVYPPADNVFEWTKHGSIEDVKVVILGQDPYHGPQQAHGLCFSVKKGVRPPPSLVNMFKELEADIPGFKTPNHGCLNGWAEQGVLLLNAVLTVEAGKANSHKDMGWEKVTDAVISWISKNLDSVVFLLWGAYAHKKAAIVDKTKHHLIQTVHPSPLSAHRGFLGCKHFSKCNELLAKSGKKPIDWKYLP